MAPVRGPHLPSKRICDQAHGTFTNIPTNSVRQICCCCGDRVVHAKGSMEKEGSAYTVAPRWVAYRHFQYPTLLRPYQQLIQWTDLLALHEHCSHIYPVSGTSTWTGMNRQCMTRFCLLAQIAVYIMVAAMISSCIDQRRAHDAYDEATSTSLQVTSPPCLLHQCNISSSPHEGVYFGLSTMDTLSCLLLSAQFQMLIDFSPCMLWPPNLS